MKCLFNPLQPNISMYFVHIVLHTFPKMLKGRICLSSVVGDHFLFSHNLQQWYCKEMKKQKQGEKKLVSNIF